MAFDWFFKGDRQVYEFMVLRCVMLVFVCFSLMGLVMTEYWVFVILVLSGYVLIGGGLRHFQVMCFMILDSSGGFRPFLSFVSFLFLCYAELSCIFQVF